jgi:hypothetical protein
MLIRKESHHGITSNEPSRKTAPMTDEENRHMPGFTGVAKLKAEQEAAEEAARVKAEQEAALNPNKPEEQWQ